VPAQNGVLGQALANRVLQKCFPALFQSRGPQPAREANVKSMYGTIRLLFLQPDSPMKGY
jgi:hypothetical protein